MLTAIAIDDEPNALEIIQLHALKIPFLELKQSFRDALDAIAWLQTNSVDLLFLDINMPHLSGLKFRQLIGEQPMIIFTTAYAEYAAESYNLNAIDYLLKPIAFERFLKGVLKAQQHLQIKKTPRTSPPISSTKLADQRIYVKSGAKLYQVDPAEILYLKKEGNYVTFHTSNKKIVSRLNMSQILELLPNEGFLKVHKSYIVALRHIEVSENHQVIISGVRIPVAKVYREVLSRHFS